ncbi:MAG TPA: ABC transporter ATP-binding protein [Spirochaetia bacterium]|nr:ABC transporter ATP-binding protein [Spirochaetia bacterium]
MRLELQGITKRFGDLVANDRIDLTAEEGRIHALLGENGAGKTTLMNVLTGLYHPDEGRLLLDGVVTNFHDPGEAIRAGIGMVHQHFMLIPVFTVAENVMLGFERTRQLGFLDLRRANEEIRELSRKFGLEVNPTTVVEELSVGQQQRVEIVKALARDAKILILDEPTAVLTPQEIEDLFKVMSSLRESGRTILFITHKLKEVLEVADTITVIRAGKVVGSTTPPETNENELASMMVGRGVELTVEKRPADPKQTVLSVHDLVVLDEAGRVAVEGISFEVRAGEILAVAGVEGNGQTDLVRALTGLAIVAGGSIRVGAEELTNASPKRMLRAGVAHIPEDRLKDGLVGSFTIAENLVLDTYDGKLYSRGGALKWDNIRADAEKRIEEFDIRTQSISSAASTLSGGNQQKIIVARELSRPIQLLVASQPTRGLDVGSIEYVHGRLVQARDNGAAVVLVSAELDEVMALADRIVVMYRGQLSGPYRRDELSRNRIGLLMAGAER